MHDRLMTKKHWSRSRVLATAAIVAIVASALAATTLPGKKPGLWVSSKVIHFNMAGKPADTDNTPTVSAMCSDASTDAIEEKILTGGVNGCGFRVEGSGNTYTISGSCPDPMGGNAQMVTQGKMVWISDTQIHMESRTTSPHMSGDAVSDSKWVGACPAGVMPGDLGTFEGGVFKKTGNIKDALSKIK
jgi:hypothetical protein